MAACGLVLHAHLLVALATAPKKDLDMNLTFCCDEENDLYRVMTDEGLSCARYENSEDAVKAAPEGTGLLILADAYPQETVALSEEDFRLAREKKLRVYLEYPGFLPGIEASAPRRVHLERAVVASEVFGPSLAKGRILAIHDCHFVGVQAENAHLVAARVAGYDTAVYGLAGVEQHPLLFEREGFLVAATKLSQFVTARYAPKDAMQSLWHFILSWLQPEASVPVVDWTPAVRPTFRKEEALPLDASRSAVIRGVDWHTRARMLIHESWREEYDKARSEEGPVDPSNPVGPLPDPSWPAGDGEHGVLEGFGSRIGYNGQQSVRWWLRTDSNGESSLAFAGRSKLDGDERSARIASNLLDWVYFNSGLFFDDPDKSTCGLVRWAYDSGSLYGDNDARIILGCIGSSALLETDRWDEALCMNILGNFRTTSPLGFRKPAINDEELLSTGWTHYWANRYTHFAPHYQSWIWATYLWLYDKTGYEPLLTKTEGGIRAMMEGYPEKWQWTNGIQQERARMLLCLAWLVRVDDTPEHREWLKTMASELKKGQDESGAIREELGDLSKGSYRPPPSNEAYGTNEASLIQDNGDPVADLLYTCNFAFLGLHEAHAATGDALLGEMEDELAEFLVRIQVRSENHPELDGGWFRAFDYERWEYWGSNADHGWGAWSMEVGWTQGWISSVLAMRELGVNLWDVSAKSRVGERWESVKERMLPDELLDSLKPAQVAHEAVGCPVAFASKPDPRYPGEGQGTLTDGYLGTLDHTASQWMGWWEEDLEATIDLGEEKKVNSVAARFLLSQEWGIFLPERLTLSFSRDGETFSVAATLTHELDQRKETPRCHTMGMDRLEGDTRFVRIHAKSVGNCPPWHMAAGEKAWLFCDEILVNPERFPEDAREP